MARDMTVDELSGAINKVLTDETIQRNAKQAGEQLKVRQRRTLAPSRRRIL